MKPQKLLEDNSTKIYDLFSLSQNERIVYEAILKFGENNASTIADLLKMDKSSVYNASLSLKEKNLLISNERIRGTTYLAVNPDIFKEKFEEIELNIQQKGRAIDDFIADIKQRANKFPHESYITIETGIEAHEKAMRRSWDCKEKFLRMKTNSQSPIFLDESNIRFMKEEYLKKRIRKKIYLHQLFQYAESYALDYMNKTDSALLKEMRIMPDTFTSFDSLIIYDDCVTISIVEQGKDVMVMTILDNSIASIMKEFFDFVWVHSLVYYGKPVLQSIKLPKGTEVSRIGMGTRGIGAWDSFGKAYKLTNPYFEENYTKEGLGYFLSSGVNYIDLCMTYANGRSVDTISNLIRNYPRKNLIISGKLALQDGEQIKRKSDIEKQCDAYLKKLNTDHLDLFQIHFPEVTSFSVSETIYEIEKLIEKGKVKNLSVGNFDISNLEEGIKASKTGIVFNEVPFNLYDKGFESNGTIDYCLSHQISLIFVRTLGLGRLCGLEEDLEAPVLIKELAKKYGRTSGQISLNWILSKYPKHCIAVVKSENPNHIKENIAALEFNLSDEDIKKLDLLNTDFSLSINSVKISKK